MHKLANNHTLYHCRMLILLKREGGILSENTELDLLTITELRTYKPKNLCSTNSIGWKVGSMLHWQSWMHLSAVLMQSHVSSLSPFVLKVQSPIHSPHTHLHAMFPNTGCWNIANIYTVFISVSAEQELISYFLFQVLLLLISQSADKTNLYVMQGARPDNKKKKH